MQPILMQILLMMINLNFLGIRLNYYKIQLPIVLMEFQEMQ